MKKNSKQTLVFNFNNAVTAEHIHDDDDESSEVLIGNRQTQKIILTLLWTPLLLPSAANNIYARLN